MKESEDLSEGVLYIATASEFLSEACRSANTLHETNNINSAIITTKELKSSNELSIFDRVISIEVEFDDLRDKVYNMGKSPFDKTIYLDCDTLVVGDISSLFDLLDRVDIAGCYASTRYKVRIPEIPESLPEVSTAVLAYNNSSQDIQLLFEDWKNRLDYQIKEGRPRDGETIPKDNADTLEEASSFGNFYGQTPFREALFHSNVKYSILPPEYNYGHSNRCFAKYEVKILHGSKRDDLFDIINERETKRVLVGNHLHYPSDKTKVRIGGLPILDPIIHRLDLAEFTKRLGVYPYVKRIYDGLK